MSRTALIVWVALAMLAGAAPTSAAAMQSLGSVGVPATSSGLAIAFDESFVYWVGKAVPHDGDRSRGDDNVVMRMAFAGGTAAELYRVRAADSDHIGRLEVGGGIVGIDVHRGSNDDFGDGSTRIIRFATDGSNPIEVASAAFTLDRDQFRNSDSLDCGSVVQLNDVSSSGDVYYALNQRLRKTSPCSNGKNVNHWQYFRFKTDGSRNQFFSSSAAATGAEFSGREKTDSDEAPKFECGCRELGERELRAVGDWALAISKRKLTLVNVVTGKRTSGYSAGPRALYQQVDLDSAGRVIVQDGSSSGASTPARLFRKPGSLKSVPLRGDVSNRFCGDRILATTYKGSGAGTVAVFDRSRTGKLATKRTGKYSLRRNQWLLGCTAGTLVRILIGKQNFHLSALALPRRP